MLNYDEWTFFKRAILRYLDQFKKIELEDINPLIAFLHGDDSRFIKCGRVEIGDALNDLVTSSNVQMRITQEGRIVFYEK